MHAIVALGVVIRGETSHYDYVCQSCSNGIMRVMLKTGKPIGFGVLTVDNDKQALARAEKKAIDAANVATDMLVRMGAAQHPQQ